MEPQSDGARSGGGGGGSKPPVVACGYSGDDDEKPRKNARARREKKPFDRGGVAVKSRTSPRESWSRRQIELVRGVVAESKRVAWPSSTHTFAGMIATVIFAAIVAALIAFVRRGL